MTIQRFSKGEAIRCGWNTTKDNLGFFVGVLIVAGLIYYVPGIIAKLLDNDAQNLSISISFSSWVIDMAITMGLIRMSLRFCDNEKAGYADLFSCFSLLSNYLIATILFWLIFFGGLLLHIIPGIIWSVKFQCYGYFIVDQGLGPMEALKRSAAITKGALWNLILFDSLLVLINILGIICLLIGLFVTIPTTMVAMAFVYRKLLVQQGKPMGEANQAAMEPAR